MEKNNMTAVEWLVNQEISVDLGSGIKMIIPIPQNVIDKAKQMEKEQNIGLLIWMNQISKSEPMRLETDFDDIVEQYYNETFGNK